jgi:hypothetical protein
MTTACSTVQGEPELLLWLRNLADWDVFFTGTTRYEATCRSIRKSFERLMRDHYRSISYVYVCEPHKGCGFHVHAMFDQPYVINWKTFWQRWYDQYGRARTEPIRHKADVADYHAKYLTKTWGNGREVFGEPKPSSNHFDEIWWDCKIAHRQFKNP